MKALKASQKTAFFQFLNFSHPPHDIFFEKIRKVHSRVGPQVSVTKVSSISTAAFSHKKVNMFSGVPRPI